MNRHADTWPFSLLRCAGFGLLLGVSPGWACAQAPADQPGTSANIVSASPVELFYKAQVGYERRVGQRNSIGLMCSYNYGVIGAFKGGQATAFYRRFITRAFPTGLFLQAQASVLNFSQEAHLVKLKTYEPYSFHYRATSTGAGFGIGYRGRFLRRVSGGHLLYTALLGVRFQGRPLPSYDATIYEPKTGFLGGTDDSNWYLGPGPGSISHGLLTLDYQF
jgi:hypothetical protein